MPSKRRQRAQPEAQLRDLDVALAVEVAALPGIGVQRERRLRRAGGAGAVLQRPAPREVVVDVEHVRRVRGGDRTLAADDEEVLVVVERRAVAEVVAAAHHGARRRERIDDDDLVVRHREAGREDLLLPAGRDVVVERLRLDDTRILLAAGAVQLVGERLCGGGIGHAAAHEQVLVRLLRRCGPGGDIRRAGKEDEEEDRLLRARDQLRDLLHVRRRNFPRDRCAQLGRVRREPAGRLRAAGERDRLRRRTPRPQRCRLQLGRVASGSERVGGEPLPVVEVATRERGVVADDRVVRLRAQAGRGPVGRAEQHGLRRAVAVDVDDVLVVADLAVGEHAGDQLARRLREPQARRRVAVAQRARALRVAGVRVREDQVQALAGAFERADQLVVAELVERRVERAAGPGAADEGEQRRDHVAGETRSQRTLRLGDRGEQLRLRGLAAERVRDPLGRDQAAVEDRGDAGRDDGRDRDLVRDHERHLHRFQLAGRAGEGNDLVAKAPRAGAVGDEARVRVLPVELLDRERRRRLPSPGDKAREDRHRRQRRLGAGGVDPVDDKAHAAGELGAIAPGDDDDVVVAEGDGVLHAGSRCRSNRSSLGVSRTRSAGFPISGLPPDRQNGSTRTRQETTLMGITRRDLLQTVGAAGLASLAGTSRAQAGTLKISHQFPGGTINEGDFRDRLCRRFAADIEKRSNGALKAQVYPGSSLMKTVAQFSAMRKGALDISLYPLPYAGGEVAETNIGLMPALVPSYEVGAQWKNSDVGRMLAKILDDKGIVLLSWIWQAGGVASRATPLVQPEDAKGLKVRGGSREMDMMLKQAGASVISLPSNEIYAAMQTGAMDAAMTSSTSFISFKLEELAKHLTSGRQRTYWFMFEPLLMSKDVFSKMPKPQQDLIMAIGGEMEKFATEGAIADDKA